MRGKMHRLTGLIFALALTGGAVAAPETYVVDSNHTFPSFEVSHAGGFTTTRGMFLKTSGKIVIDRTARSGAIEIVVDTASLTTGHARRDDIVRDAFKTTEFPHMTYRSTRLVFSADTLSGVDGELTLLGVTKPVALSVTSFKCRPHPVNKKDQCGADGIAQIKRSDFGLNATGGTGDDIKILFQIETFRE
jgi:polyisoprenoid-binding protein YceI